MEAVTCDNESVKASVKEYCRTENTRKVRNRNSKNDKIKNSKER